MTVIGKIWNLSDTISQNVTWISEAAKPAAMQVSEVVTNHFAAAARNFSADSENIMRAFKAFEPVLTCFAFTEACTLISEARKVLTALVRPLKGANALLNNVRDPFEDALSWSLRTYVAPISYSSLAIASGISLANKHGVISLSKDRKESIDKYLKYVGTAGSLIAGFGGFYAWYRVSQQIQWQGTSSKLVESRFWNLCNGLRYTLEGVIGVAGWENALLKAAPASIGLYQSVVRSWIRTSS